MGKSAILQLASINDTIAGSDGLVELFSPLSLSSRYPRNWHAGLAIFLPPHAPLFQL